MNDAVCTKVSYTSPAFSPLYLTVSSMSSIYIVLLASSYKAISDGTALTHFIHTFPLVLHSYRATYTQTFIPYFYLTSTYGP